MFPNILYFVLYFVVVLDAQDADLPGYISQQVTIPEGSFVIPMSTTLQQESLGVFNLKAYGAVVRLLWARVPVIWAIDSSKNRGATDFSAECIQATPNTTSKAVRNFGVGSFIVHANHAPLGFANISAWATLNGVSIYNITNSTRVPMRYNLTFRPLVGVINTTYAAPIQANYLSMAGMIEGTHFTYLTAQQAGNVSFASCYTMLTEPHFDPTQSQNGGVGLSQVNFSDRTVGGLSSTPLPSRNPSLSPTNYVRAVRSFLASGGNLLAQCAAVATYENCAIRLNNLSSSLNSTTCPDGLFLTPGGLNLRTGIESVLYVNNTIFYTDPGNPLMQFDTDWVTTGGAVKIMQLWPCVRS
eukprot:TRINITY_DN4953_c0_g1_i2.p1 TRINITY_DN4953_c0_g1~~TRINITY_DN4953_c0_g1_i2.p1  ORF type:complete len:356 (-),score=2.81 TRINITY_DN4953_c0_g1_i2:479-1546(-)